MIKPIRCLTILAFLISGCSIIPDKIKDHFPGKDTTENPPATPAVAPPAIGSLWRFKMLNRWYEGVPDDLNGDGSEFHKKWPNVDFPPNLFAVTATNAFGVSYHQAFRPGTSLFAYTPNFVQDFEPFTAIGAITNAPYLPPGQH